jgi:hypothetical protein
MVVVCALANIGRIGEKDPASDKRGRTAKLATHGGVPKGDLRLLTGADLLREYRSSPTTTRSFCNQCGSQLFWQNDAKDWVAMSCRSPPQSARIPPLDYPIELSHSV